MMYLLRMLKLLKFIVNRFSLFIYLILAMISVTVVYDIIYMSYENVNSILDMIYYNVVTASTVGYGDMSPSTNVGKIATSIYIPIIISLFAALLSVIGSMIFSYFSRKNKGKVRINKDIDFVIIGGYKEKIESVVNKLLTNSPSLKLCVISDVYDDKPKLFITKGVSWIKGVGTDVNKLKMVDYGNATNYIILSLNPTNKNSDSFVKIAYENILSINSNPNILAEVVRDNLIGFPQSKMIRYVQVSRSSILAKEALTPGVFDFFHQVFNNTNNGNQYNIIIDKDETWNELCLRLSSKSIIPIGYLCNGNWIFSPETSKDFVLKAGCKIKCLTRSMNFESETDDNLLIIANDSYRAELIIKDYKSDSRFKNSSITVIGKNLVSTADKFISSSDPTDEKLYISNGLDVKDFENILILGNTLDPENDNKNFLVYSLLRDLNPNAQVVVEIVNSEFRNLLESKYEDRKNQFTGISQTEQLVQELQDEGAISFIEEVSNDTTEVDIYETTLQKDYLWGEILTKMTLGIYPVGYKMENEDWLFEPENNDIKLPKNTIIKYIGRRKVELGKIFILLYQ